MNKDFKIIDELDEESEYISENEVEEEQIVINKIISLMKVIIKKMKKGKKKIEFKKK